MRLEIQMSTNRFDDRQAILVAPLSHFRRDDITLAGGKGANLGELIHAGFPIPPGFIITTAAYDLLLKKTNLQSYLADLIASHDLNDADSVKNFSQEIHTALHETSIPGEITEAIGKACQELTRGAVAVRSSATAEDLPQAAFAGQQETFLNIQGEQEVLKAVRACWASLWSERAILYRAHQNVDQTAVKLAVVVQEMVPADAAGVMFTANPISGARDELVIDSSQGLGEAVVSGSVTPDHFIVNKRSGRVKEQQSGKREIVIRAKVGGGTEQVSTHQEITGLATLPTLALKRLWKLGVEIERHYGAPQDIEWAWVHDGSKRGELFVLQSRPVTALPEPLRVSGPMRLVLPMLVEMWPTRPYPLDMTTFTGAVERAIGNFLVSVIGRSAPSPDEMFQEEDGVIVQFKPPQVHPSPSILVMPWVAIWRTRHYDPARWEADPRITELITKVNALEHQDLRSLTWMQNMETLHEALAQIPGAMELRERYFPQALLGLARLWLLLALAGRRESFGVLVSGVKTKTTETNQALEDLAKQIRTDSRLQDIFQHIETQDLRNTLERSDAGQAFLERFQLFLERYGHRETALTISQPAWKDQPDAVLGILKVLAGTESQRTGEYEAWQTRSEELLTHSILRTRLLRKLFLQSLANARAFFQIREDTHFYLTLAQPTIRRVSLELGRRLAEVGALAEMEEVFHLRLAELEDIGKQ